MPASSFLRPAHIKTLPPILMLSGERQTFNAPLTNPCAKEHSGKVGIEMSSGRKENLTETEKTILTGRIYPTIKECINNRYKIILSFFAYYAFMLQNNAVFVFVKEKNLNFWISLLFGFFIIHNFLNYFLNAKDQLEIEQKQITYCKIVKSIVMEILFSTFSIIAVWRAHIIIKNISLLINL